MPAVVADTGPLNYLALIDRASLLPKLFGTVFVPEVVRDELLHPKTPLQVREWIAASPSWLAVRPDLVGRQSGLQSLDAGERSAITLALSMNSELVLMDDRAGVAISRTRGLAVMGTLGILDLAARRSLLDLEEAFARLRSTSFRCRPQLFDTLIARHRLRKGE